MSAGENVGIENMERLEATKQQALFLELIKKFAMASGMGLYKRRHSVGLNAKQDML